jgi:hypothetical protein
MSSSFESDRALAHSRMLRAVKSALAFAQRHGVRRCRAALLGTARQFHCACRTLWISVLLPAPGIPATAMMKGVIATIYLKRSVEGEGPPDKRFVAMPLGALRIKGWFCF